MGGIVLRIIQRPFAHAVSAFVPTLLLSLVLSALPPAQSSAADADPVTRAPVTAPPVFFTGNPDAATLLAGAEAQLTAAQQVVDRMLAVKGRRTVGNTLAPFNEAITSVENAAYQSHLMESVHPDSAYRAGAEAMTQKASKFLDELGLNRDVYEALCAVDGGKADPATRYFLKKTLDDYRRAGVDKDEATRRQIAALLDEITKTGQEFQKNINNDSRTIQVDGAAELEGLPEDFIKSHAPGPDGKITLSIESPDLFPVIRYAKNAEVRRRLLHEDRNRAYPANVAVLDSLIAKRHRLARMLGYATWADYITEDKMIETAKNAADFIARLRETTYRRAQEEYALYLKRKQEDDPAATSLNRWEVTYYGRLIRKRDYDFDPQEIRPYLPFDRVKQGVLDVTAATFGLTYRRIENAAVWHPSVEAYEVYDGDRLLGRFFLDLHPRPGKFNHAARFGVRQGAAGIQVPEAALICNFPGGKPDDPGLMEHSDVATFFHEFGHLLHSILGGQGRWSGVAGTAVQRDFVEAPSQILEEWCRDAKVLRTFAKHHQTGEPVPVDLVERMRKADAFGRALGVSGQTLLAALSFEVYSRPPDQVDTDRIVRELEPKYTPVPPMPDTHMQTSFGHLNGYSAVYYTYQWSLVIAKDLFGQFDRSNLLDPKVAKRYRDAVLARGGSRPAKELVREFLGREYNFKAYDDWLAGRG
jgi:thimet oligopeptidase